MIRHTKKGDKWLQIREYNNRTRDESIIDIWADDVAGFYSVLQEVLAEMKFDESP